MFSEEVKKSLGFDFSGFRATIFGDGAIYISGVGRIKSFSKTEVVFYLKKGTVSITGEELEIKKICEGDALICGRIKTFSRD
ncbi:MAG: YabP/YqfC family sporulation protein [Clostridia bacterium]|nr:YabP/YqfC family sporulation protein [Clostridia bacterium]